MTKKKKIIISVITACVAVALIVFIIIWNMPVRVLKLQPDNIPIIVSVYSKESVSDRFFSIAVMGQPYDYRIVVKEKGLFGSTLLDQSFRFRNDGAPIHDYNVSIEMTSIELKESISMVKITISGSEMSDKNFYVQLNPDLSQ